MLKEMGNAIVAKLQGYATLKQVEFYEGQLDPDKIGQWAITPPTVFVELMGADIASSGLEYSNVSFNLHILTTKLLHDPASMLDIVEWIMTNFQDKGLRNSPDTGVSLGRTFVTGFENAMTLAGLTYYEMRVEVR
jgi:hypothetical protein